MYVIESQQLRSKRRLCSAEVGSDTSEDDNIPLAKLAFNSWSDSDGDVPFSVRGL